MYKGRSVMEEAGICSKLFFSWARPFLTVSLYFVNVVSDFVYTRMVESTNVAAQAGDVWEYEGVAEP